MIYKLTINSEGSFNKVVKVASVAEVIEYVKNGFCDIPAMPQDFDSVLIENVPEFIQVNGNYVPNPDYKTT